MAGRSHIFRRGTSIPIQEYLSFFVNGYTMFIHKENSMITRISKWGNSQGVRIPNDILKSIGYHSGDAVNVSATENGILIQKMTKQPKELHAAGILKGYVKRHISDKEMENAWNEAAVEKWNEKNC